MTDQTAAEQVVQRVVQRDGSVNRRIAVQVHWLVRKGWISRDRQEKVKALSHQILETRRAQDNEEKKGRTDKGF